MMTVSSVMTRKSASNIMFWRKPKAVIAKPNNGPYRTMAEVPPQPKVETKEEKAARMKAEHKNRNMVATLGVSAVPSASLLAIGAEWTVMTQAMATMTILATCLVSVGVLVATGIKLDWFD